MANELDVLIAELKVTAKGLGIDLGTPFMQDLFSGLQVGSDALQKRQQAAHDALEAAISVLRMTACTCQRKFPYSGPIVKPCSRCLAIVAWEKARDLKGESKTEQYLKTSVKV